MTGDCSLALDMLVPIIVRVYTVEKVSESMVDIIAFRDQQHRSLIQAARDVVSTRLNDYKGKCDILFCDRSGMCFKKYWYKLYE